MRDTHIMQSFIYTCIKTTCVYTCVSLTLTCNTAQGVSKHSSEDISLLLSQHWPALTGVSLTTTPHSYKAAKRESELPQDLTPPCFMMEQTIRALQDHLPTCLPVSQLFVCSLGNSPWIHNLETSLNGGSGFFY